MKRVLLALLTGIALGILIAPEQGAKIRKRLVNAFNDLTEDMGDESVI
ncbi:MAG: YtxH domain-containing protein [Ferruginibacter sp.]